MSYLDLLNNDIIQYCLLPKLSLRDQYFLCEVEYVEYLMILEVAKSKIKISDVVTTFIKDYGGFLSGSSLLKMINDESWESADFDIYIEATKYADILTYITDNKFEHQITVELEIPYAKAKYTKYIDRIITLSLLKIQLILIKDIDIKTFILNAFDFTILKNYYYHDGKYILNINHFDDIISRKLVFDIDALSYIQPDLKAGYMDSQPDTYVTRERVEKYVRRGFKVNLGDLHEDIRCLQKIFIGENRKCYIYEKSNPVVCRTITGEALPESYKGLRIPCTNSCVLTSFFEVKHDHMHIVSKDKVNNIIDKYDISSMRDSESSIWLSDSDIVILSIL